MRKPAPAGGLENSLDGRMSPDIHFSFRIFAAHWRKVNAAWSYAEHTHDMFEINVVLEGGQRMTVDGRPALLREGDLLFIPPDVRHGSDGSAEEAGMAYFCLHFDVDDLYMRRRLLTMRSYMHASGSGLELAVREPLRRIIAAVREERSDVRSHRERLAAQNACLQLIAALGEWAMQEDEQAHAVPDEASASAVRIAARIEQRLLQNVTAGDGERVGIEQIAAALGYSPAYCNRVFQRVYGVSPRRYLTGLILREAKLLLSDPERSIEEIAERLGYRDASHFSKQFKRWTSMSPLGFRRLSH